ncbi:hypothetical protein BV898_08365 [Hypsibius exemplaris]|uniref:Uncharacterized protein n=1 Tax=Hypsibius exemplaris TaxID=2072580 RepID=A0A1W0WQW0_HYPEX|nr:hypothetical protein BV898_08365 [Hypsibius exemplaris]
MADQIKVLSCWILAGILLSSVVIVVAQGQPLSAQSLRTGASEVPAYDAATLDLAGVLLSGETRGRAKRQAAPWKRWGTGFDYGHLRMGKRNPIWNGLAETDEEMTEMQTEPAVVIRSFFCLSSNTFFYGEPHNSLSAIRQVIRYSGTVEDTRN